jgi:putative transposase
VAQFSVGANKKWTMPIRDGKAALTRFSIQVGDRISVN